MKISRLLMTTAIAFAGIALYSIDSNATVTGVCTGCHTMHNSQGGAVMGTADPNPTLLKNTCFGCHTGVNDGTNTIPYVLTAGGDIVYDDTGTEAGTNTLAGGNFYWVDDAGGNTDTKGHNINGLSGQDATLGLTPPGGVVMAAQMECGGLYGCHGDRTEATSAGAIRGAHHGSDAAIDGSTVAKSFRWLDGVVGKEDSDWEYQPTAAAHNQYKGVDRATDTDEDTSTISSLCAQCHSDFHNGAGDTDGVAIDAGFSSAWIRHPVDYDMNNVSSGEVGDYGGNGVNAYQVIAPVASANVAAVKATVLQAADDAIVTCISCHRAHGSPYADMLRWDYPTNTVVGTPDATSGCFLCHTQKD